MCDTVAGPGYLISADVVHDYSVFVATVIHGNVLTKCVIPGFISNKMDDVNTGINMAAIGIEPVHDPSFRAMPLECDASKVFLHLSMYVIC